MEKAQYEVRFSKDPRVTSEMKAKIRREAEETYGQLQVQAALRHELELTRSEQERLFELRSRILEKLGVLEEFQEIAKLQREIADRRTAVLLRQRETKK
ncbi:MAG: hypothetical protein ACE5JX_21335 [Acidobacteriota bacterium]